MNDSNLDQYNWIAFTGLSLDSNAKERVRGLLISRKICLLTEIIIFSQHWKPKKNTIYCIGRESIHHICHPKSFHFRVFAELNTHTHGKLHYQGNNRRPDLTYFLADTDWSQMGNESLRTIIESVPTTQLKLAYDLT